MKSFRTILASLSLLSLAGLGAACNEADELRDCQEVCSRYETCLGGADYDVPNCRSSCETKVDQDKSLEDNLDACAKCLDSDMTCGETAWQCSTQCAALIPVVANP